MPEINQTTRPTLGQLFAPARERVRAQMDQAASPDEAERLLEENATELVALLEQRCRDLGAPLTPLEQQILSLAQRPVKGITATTEAKVLWDRLAPESSLPAVGAGALSRMAPMLVGAVMGRRLALRLIPTLLVPSLFSVVLLVVIIIVAASAETIAALAAVIIVQMSALYLALRIGRHRPRPQASGSEPEPGPVVVRSAWASGLVDWFERWLFNLDNLASVAARAVTTQESPGRGIAGDLQLIESLQSLFVPRYTGATDTLLPRLEQLESVLEQHGVEVVDFDGVNAELFEFPPSSRSASTGPVTLRPAITSAGRVLLTGRAVR